MTKKLLLAAVILGISGTAVAETAPAPATQPIATAPLAMAPALPTPEQMQAAHVRHQQALQAAYAARRQVPEQFTVNHGEEFEAARSRHEDTVSRVKQQSEAMQADMDRMSDALRVAVLSGDRAETDRFFEAKAAEMEQLFESRAQEFEAAAKASDARFARAAGTPAPLTPFPAPQL